MKYLLILMYMFPFSAFTQSLNMEVPEKRTEIIKLAESYLGYKYRSKVSKVIFDCSGYVKFLMASIGENITRSSISQIHDGNRILELDRAKPGDILVFKGRNSRNNRPGHVGIVHHWGTDTLYFIHSSSSKGIVIGNMYDPYFIKRFLQVRDVIGNKD